MPAIQLERLKQQAAQLAERFNQPAAFSRELSDLFEFYADRTKRPSQSGTPQTVIQAYQVPEPVMRHILSALDEAIEKEPEAVFALMNALWRRPQLEFRVLAARLLGRMPPQPLEPITDRLISWHQENEEGVLLESLAGDSLRRLRSEESGEFFQLVEGWLNSKAVKDRILSLSALRELVRETAFANFPPVFRLLDPVLRKASSELRPYALEALIALVLRTPNETAYFLRQNLEAGKTATNSWLLRHSVEQFPPELRDGLKEMLKT